MRLSRSLAILLAGSALAGCSTMRAPFGREPAKVAASQPTSRATSAMPVVSMASIPNPEIIKPESPQPVGTARSEKPRRDTTDPTARVSSANEAARVRPTRDGYSNAVQVYAYEEGALFQVYATPGRVTDIALEPGEQLSGAVAAGDTVRWIIGDTESGSGPNRRVHILVKPTGPGLATNLVINTDRRTYHVELSSTASTYMASVAWRYSETALLAATEPTPSADAPLAPGADSARYRISGPAVAWRPVRAWDDGRQVVVEFPESVARDELPPLFVVGRFGRSDLVNYRVRGRHMIVDRLFQTAELRLGERGAEQRVRITREKRDRS